MRPVLLAFVALFLSACLASGQRVVSWDCNEFDATCQHVSVDFLPTPEPTATIPPEMSTWRLGLGSVIPLNLYSRDFGPGPAVLGGNMQSPAAGAGSNYVVGVREMAVP